MPPAASLTPAAFALALGAALAGCAAPAPAPTGTIERPYAAVFAAAGRALAPAPIERSDEAAGRLETAWFEVLAERTTGYLFEGHFVERRRFEVALWPVGARTAVHVGVRAERRAPGGTRAIRWQRFDPPPDLATDVFRSIEKEALK